MVGGSGAAMAASPPWRPRCKGVREEDSERSGLGRKGEVAQGGFICFLKFYFSFSSFSVFVFLKQNRKEFLIKKLYKIGLV